MFIKFADWLVYNILELSPDTNLGSALHFFVYDVIKILFLLFIIITTISFLRRYIDNEKFKKYIEKQPRFIAHFLAAALGAITPFCSCSSIPLYVGFIETGMPFGVAMTFLITSPMINEIAVIVLASVIGLKITLLYLVTGICVGMFGGYLMEKLGFQKYLQEYVKEPTCCSTKKSCSCSEKKLDFRTRIIDAMTYAKDLMSKIWLFIVIGVGVGAGLHGYVPQEFFIKYTGADNFFAVPMAVIAGMPLYADATTMIPIAQVLIQKGTAIGTVLVFMMATVAISLPEMIILSKVMKRELIFRFITFMLITFIFVGYFYNLIISESFINSIVKFLNNI